MAIRICSGVFYHGKYGFKAFLDGDVREFRYPINPYCFVAEDIGGGKWTIEETDYRSVDGKRVWKVSVSKPAEVRNVRNKYVTYEADIRFLDRLFIDKVFVADYGMDNVVYMDTEWDDYGRLIALGYGFVDGDVEVVLGDEKHILEEYVENVVKAGKTVVVGWNVQFDYENLLELAGKYGYEDYIKVQEPLDLRTEYMATVKGLVKYALDDVGEYEGFGGKKGEFSLDMSREELVEYNRWDVELLRLIDRRYKFIETKLELANYVNLLPGRVKALSIGDALIIRRLRELGYVAPNVGKKKRRSYEGALTLSPKPGLHENVVVFDISSMYPNIIVNNRIDVDGFEGEVLPTILEDLLRRKEEAGKAGDKVKRTVYKVMANALYGLFGFPSFRFYDPSKASMVTAEGRRILSMIKDEVESLGYEVVYGDTDSVFIKMDRIGDADILAEYLNMVIEPYEIKVDYVFRKLFLYNVKKKYVGIMADGRWRVAGNELVRRDWCRFAKNVVKRVFEMVFEGRSKEEINQFLNKMKMELYAGKRDEELVLVKKLNKTEYKNMTQHYKAFLDGKRRGYIDEKKWWKEVPYVIGADGEPKYWTGREKINYGYYWNNQVKPAVKRVLDILYGGVVSLDKYIK